MSGLDWGCGRAILDFVQPENDSAGRRRITLDDLARAAGISRSAASKAMRDHPRISEATRRKVQRLAEEMGYRRDPALTRLAKFRWNSRDPGGGEPLAFLYPYRSDRTYDESFRQACENVARANGYVFHPLYAGDYPAPRLCKILQARGIRGVIFQRIVDPVLIGELVEARFVCVAVDEGPVLGPCELIRPDYLWAITEAIRRHQEAGRDHLALLLRAGMRETAFADRMRAVWEHEGFPRESIIVHDVRQPAVLAERLRAIRPAGLVSFLKTPLPSDFDSPAGRGDPCPQFVLRLFQHEVAEGGGFFLSEERTAGRALHYLESRLIDGRHDSLHGTTLMRPQWIPPRPA